MRSDLLIVGVISGGRGGRGGRGRGRGTRGRGMLLVISIDLTTPILRH